MVCFRFLEHTVSLRFKIRQRFRAEATEARIKCANRGGKKSVRRLVIRFGAHRIDVVGIPQCALENGWLVDGVQGQMRKFALGTLTVDGARLGYFRMPARRTISVGNPGSSGATPK